MISKKNLWLILCAIATIVSPLRAMDMNISHSWTVSPYLGLPLLELEVENALEHNRLLAHYAYVAEFHPEVTYNQFQRALQAKLLHGTTLTEFQQALITQVKSILSWIDILQEGIYNPRSSRYQVPEDLTGQVFELISNFAKRIGIEQVDSLTMHKLISSINKNVQTIESTLTNKRQSETELVFTLATHPRVGANSPARHLDASLLQYIMLFVRS